MVGMLEGLARLYRPVTTMLLITSVSLFITSIIMEAPHLVTVAFSIGITAYAIMYPPWDGHDLDVFDGRARIGIISVFITFGFFLLIAILQTVVLSYDLSEYDYPVLDPEPASYLSAASAVLIGWAEYRTTCGLIYAITGKSKALRWII